MISLVRISFILHLFVVPGFTQIDKNIQNIIDQPESEYAQWGISLKSDDGNVLYERFSQAKMIPASTLKLVTTLAALSILGPETSLSAEVMHTGELLEDGTLQGDVFILGSGDPSFGSPLDPNAHSWNEALNQVLQIIKSAGIKCIDGDVIIYNGLFDDVVVNSGWSWDDLTNYYASGTSGFNLHENFYYVNFERSIGQDQPTKIHSVIPEVPGLQIDNRVLTGPWNSGDNAYIFGNPYDYNRWIEGTIPSGKGLFKIKGALPDPATFGAYHIYNFLTNHAISCQGYKVVTELPKDLKNLGKMKSPIMFTLTSYANEVSNNLYCETFLKLIGVALVGKGSFEQGIKGITEWAVRSKLPVDEIHLQDGSGLSARNRVSANFMTALINKGRQELGDDKMKNLIPKVGEKGSVRSFLQNKSSQSHTWLKSGSINNVVAYSGIIQLSSGELASISIMANGHSSNRKLRGQIQNIIELLYHEF